MPEMSLDEYDRLFAVEDRLWLSRGLRRIALQALAPRLPQGDRPRVLEAACGTGAMLDALRDCARPVGIDLSPAAVRYCLEREHHDVARASMTALPFQEQSFDAVLCLDALGALPGDEDAVALAEMARVSRPGGVLILWAAAHPALYGAHDRATGMAQRHCRRTLRTKVERAGFAVEKLCYANMFLFPGVALVRLLRRLLPAGSNDHSDVVVPPGPINALLTQVMFLEAALLRRTSLPIGLSLLVIGHRR